MQQEYRLLFRKYKIGNVYDWMKEGWDRWCYDLSCEVRQYPPSARTLIYYNYVSAKGIKWNKRKKRFFVQMPSMVFIKRNHFMLAVAKKLIESEKDEVYFPPVSNVYSNHSICLAYMGEKDGLAPFDQRVNYFWNAAADMNTVWTGRKAIEHNFGSLYDWEEMSLDEVVDNLKFRPITLKKLAGRSFKLGEIEDIPRWEDQKDIFVWRQMGRFGGHTTI